MKPINPATVARALVAAVTVVVETMPAQQRQSVHNVLGRAISNGMVDGQTARILKHLVDEPQSRQQHLNRPASADE
jgi:hypothetical protein